MSDMIRLCSCGGRELLAEEVLCPSCVRSRKSVLWQLKSTTGKIGNAGSNLISKSVEHVKSNAEALKAVAAPVLQTSVEALKSQAASVSEAATSQAKAQSVKIGRAALPYAEKALNKARTYLDGKDDDYL